MDSAQVCTYHIENILLELGDTKQTSCLRDISDFIKGIIFERINLYIVEETVEVKRSLLLCLVAIFSNVCGWTERLIIVGGMSWYHGKEGQQIVGGDWQATDSVAVLDTGTCWN